MSRHAATGIRARMSVLNTRAAVGGRVVAIVMATSTLAISFAMWPIRSVAASGPADTVTPATGLVDKETVTVSYSGFPPADTVLIVAQCLKPGSSRYSGNPASDCIVGTSKSVAPTSGGGKVSFKVSTVDNYGELCNGTTAICEVNVRPDSGDFTGSASADISFGSATAAGFWQPLGPNGISYSGLSTPFAGRVLAIAAVQGAPSLYAGTLGGVWYLAGGKWSVSASPGAVSALVSTTSGYVFAGTGGGPPGALGSGVYVAKTGTNNWLATPSLDAATGSPEFPNQAIHGLVWDRASPSSGLARQHLLAAADGGVFESSNGGGTWTNVLSGATAWAIHQDPDIATKYWAAVSTNTCTGGIYTIDNSVSGAQWTQSLAISSAASARGGTLPLRISLGVVHGGIAYAEVSGCDGRQLQPADFAYTNNGGASWAAAHTQPSNEVSGWDFFDPGNSAAVGGEGSYFNALAVDSSTGCSVLVGGVWPVLDDLCGSSPVVLGTGVAPHEDISAIAFSGTPGWFYVGTDGGIFEVNDDPASWPNQAWLSLNSGMGSPLRPDNALLWGGAVDDNTGLVVAGAQDNGPLTFQGTNAVGERDDGHQTDIDQADAGYSTHYATSLWKRPANGQWSLLPDPCKTFIDTGACWYHDTLFDAPLLVDQASDGYVIVASNRLLESADGGATWKQDAPPQPISGPANVPGDCQRQDTKPTDTTQAATLDPQGDCFSALAWDTPPVVPAGQRLLLAGSDLGALWLRSARHQWHNVSGFIPVPVGAEQKRAGLPWITDVAVRSGTSGTEAWVTLGDTSPTPDESRVWYSPDVTASSPTWQPLDGAGVPGALAGAATTLILDPSSPATIYVGTAHGVVVCHACGGGAVQPSWQNLAPALPDVWVQKLTLTHGKSNLVAWTWGRGAWEYVANPSLAASPTELDFGFHFPGQSVTLSTTLVNETSGTIPPSQLAVVGADSRQFQIISNACAQVSLPPQSGCVFSVRFTPRMPGPFNAQVVAQGALMQPLNLTGVGSSFPTTTTTSTTTTTVTVAPPRSPTGTPAP
jgi:hypothetical protein